ncbi:V-type proton ATPase subunit E [Spatholobus suberectus]|nr:V-type proton ATPase subunit E [Spatholobus suberectus]
MQLNASQIKVLQGQDDVISSMKEAASKELLNVSHHHHVYRNLLKDLSVQDWSDQNASSIASEICGFINVH